MAARARRNGVDGWEFWSRARVAAEEPNVKMIFVGVVGILATEDLGVGDLRKQADAEERRQPAIGPRFDVQVDVPEVGAGEDALHLADGAGLDGEGLQIGEGTIDWVHFFKIIGEYHGTMIPEIWRGHQRRGEGFLIAIQRLSEAYFQARRED